MLYWVTVANVLSGWETVIPVVMVTANKEK